MTREQFLNELKAALSEMKEEEAQGVVSYYAEMIDDRMEAGMTEEAAVKAMEPVQVIAGRVLEEAGVAESKPESKEKGNWQQIRREAEAVRELHIQAENKRVRVITEEDTHEIQLRYCIGSNDVFRLHEDDGVLTLEHKMRPASSFVNEKNGEGVTLESILNGVGKFLSSLGERVISSGVFSYEAPENEIEITLPRTFCARVEISTGNARIQMDDITLTQPVHLTTSNAYIKLENVNCAQDITCVTSNSAITLSDVNINGARLTTSNGRVKLDDMIVRDGLIVRNSNGSIRITDCEIGGALHAATSNGAIELSDSACPDITLKTSNGAITGTVKGHRADSGFICGVVFQAGNRCKRKELLC